MGTHFKSLKITSCEVGGFVAAALIHDLRINLFTFTNFPEVDIKWDKENFHITLKTQGARSSTFSLDYKTVKSEVARFREKRAASKAVFDLIQKHAAELEGAVSNSETK